VLVSVTVTGQKDRIVMGLQKDTSIFDQNNQELIRHFSNENAPISLGIIFDTSDSMWGKIERSREPVVQFLRRSNPEDEFSLVGINDRPELLVDFTSSVDEIQDAFLKVKPGGTTALFDAIYLGLDPMKKARNKRKVLLIVSDSEDNHSRYTKKEVWSVNVLYDFRELGSSRGSGKPTPAGNRFVRMRRAKLWRTAARLVEGIQLGCYNRGCSKRSRILDCPRLPAIPESQA
jgi:hypothetical protein